MSGHAHPDAGTVRSALQLACRAPSVHNTQPWRWQVSVPTLQLHADPGRSLRITDPSGREMVISCGVVLHHARVAFAALGWHTRITRLPDPDDADHLATVEFSRADCRPDERTAMLAEAISNRHTDRRPFLAGPVPAPLREQLSAVAEAEGARFAVISEPVRRRELMVALAHADTVQRGTPAYRRELRVWAGRRAGAPAGVPATNIPATNRMVRRFPSRDFGIAGSGKLEMPLALDDGGLLCLLSTAADGRDCWLHAGEALSAVLLDATAAGLASCTLSQVAELESTRTVARLVLGDGSQPQLALRLGWPVTSEFPAPPTPRRPVDEVLRFASPAVTGEAVVREGNVESPYDGGPRALPRHRGHRAL